MYIVGKEKMSKREEKKLIKYINKKKNECGCLVLSKTLKSNNFFVSSCEIPIAQGRWLFKFLLIQILEYICAKQGNKMENLKIALVTDLNDDLITYYIEQLSTKVKTLKIVTSHRERFHNVEEKLYYNQGIVLEISNNRRKALNEVDIIFNFGLEESKFNKYKLSEKSIIINFKEKIEIKTKRFSGINANFLEINLNNRIINKLQWTKEFDLVDIYESYLYRRDTIYNIQQDIIKDNVHIKNLLGNKGVISEKEYKNILDKSYDLA